MNVHLTIADQSEIYRAYPVSVGWSDKCMKLGQLVKKKYIKNRCIAAALVVFVAFANLHSIQASTIQDAEDKRDEAQENLEEINDQIDAINEAQSSLQEEMAVYDEMLIGLLTDMDILETDIANKQVEIDQAQADLEDAKQCEQDQYEAMKLRIQYMYENSDSSIWTAISGATSMTDLLNRIEYVSEVQDYDRGQLTAYQETVQQVADLNEQLNAEMIEMEELEINLQEQATALDNLIAQKSAELEDFGAQLADAKALASEYAATIREQNEIIAEEEARIAAEEEAARIAAEEAAAAGNNTSNNSSDHNSNSENNNSNNNDNSNNSGNGSGSGTGTGLTSGGLNPGYTTSVSGSDVVAYAEQFVGNPYVYGGTSLTEGCDCSYFVMACFKEYGISLPRTSYAMQKSGQAVSYENAKAGDIICYAGHVALYMGNGKIVHASSPTNGICYGTATYRTIITIRRVL